MDLFPVYQKELVSSDLTREWKRKGQLLSSMELSQRYISTKLFIFISVKFAHCIPIVLLFQGCDRADHCQVCQQPE